MIEITPAQIRDAQAHDFSAISAVLAATEERVGQLAYRASRDNPSWREDAEQIARIQVWECIRDFSGTTVAEFFTYMDRSIRGALATERRGETRQGVSEDAAKRFEQSYRACDGDLDAAEEYVTQLDPKHRLSRANARMARLSFEGSISLNTPVGENHTLQDTLAEAVPADLRTAEDINAEEREVRRQNVRATLDMLGAQQKTVVAARTGVGMQFYGPETKRGLKHDDELAADFGLPRHRIDVIRSKGCDRFAALYVEHFAPELAGVREAAKARGEV